MQAGLDSLADLVASARPLYADDAAGTEALDALDQRLREPLRIAVAGIVKAGKSTLLNAMIGEQIAPTDAGECTRTVTWYRHARTPRIAVHLLDGTVQRMPVRKSAGSLQLDLGSLTADEVDHIEVEWPSEHLRSTVLIDTPGIASLSVETSARSLRFLTPDGSGSAADAIIYLLRHLHASDLGFLEAFRDTSAGSSRTVNAVAVLSRADEIGSGRIDSLLSAAKIADRYRRDGELRSLALGVVPVAGLLAEAARSLRESEFIALRALADLDRPVRDKALVSVDRFIRGDDTGLSIDVRRGLLARFGIFGVRLGAAIVRSGARSSSELSERMVQQSGLIELQRFVGDQFRARTAALKTRGVLDDLHALLRERPRADASAVLSGIERVTAGNHDLQELELLAESRTRILPFDDADIAAAERIIGGSGISAYRRLGLPDAAPAAEVRARVAAELAHWHRIEQSPLNERAVTERCRIVIRSLEGIAAEFGSEAGGAAADDVPPPGGPSDGDG